MSAATPEFLLQGHALTFGYPIQGDKNSPPFHTVLSGVDVCVRRGEVCALLGPNGAGKTTLLRLMLGLLRPFSGEVRLEGDLLTHFKPMERARRMAYVPQQVESRFPMTVFEAVLLGRKPHMLWGPRAKDVARTGEVLEELELTDLAERTLGELSGGQRQKVALARALAQDTPWLLLDEPTSSLDLRHQLEVLELVRRAAEERGMGVLLSLHDVNMAVRFAHKVLLLSPAGPCTGGAIVEAAGTPEAVLTPERMQRVYNVQMQKYHAKGDTCPLWFPSSV